MTRVLLAEDQVLLRDSLVALIDSTGDLSVAGQAGTGAAAVELARRCRPDVVLMDVRMPELDGIEATRRICAEGTARVLILTTFDLDEYVHAALRAGASGFLVKDSSAADVLAAVRIVAAGEALLAPTVTRRLIEQFRAQRPPSRDNSLAGLTPRETEVLRLIADGLSNTEIADRLFLGVGTVKTHVGRLLAKLSARDRAQLVIRAYDGGLVTS
ncbi:response regulator [Crossiella sp. NPDC003009]